MKYLPYLNWLRVQERIGQEIINQEMIADDPQDYAEEMNARCEIVGLKKALEIIRREESFLVEGSFDRGE